MKSEKRIYPRTKCEIKVGYKFTKWNDKNLDIIKKPKMTTSADISVTGIGLTNVMDIDHKTAGQLISGTKKVKLALYLEEDKQPLILFARLVWVDLDNEVSSINDKCGFNFLDISRGQAFKLANFIQKKIQNENNR